MSNQPPPTVADRDLETVLALVALLANPEASTARIEALREHQATLAELVETLNEARAEHERSKFALKRAEIESQKQIAADREAFKAECSEKALGLDAQEKRLTELDTKLTRERGEVATLRATLEQKLAAVRDAAA